MTTASGLLLIAVANVGLLCATGRWNGSLSWVIAGSDLLFLACAWVLCCAQGLPANAGREHDTPRRATEEREGAACATDVHQHR